MSLKRVTLRDLAKIIGVSHTTVSLALRDHPSILPARRRQIKRLAEKEGYWPHPSAPDWGNFDWSKFSIIRLGMSVPMPDSHVVTSDHQRTVLMAFEKMSQYGYERIGLVVCADFDRRLGGNYIGGFAAAQKLF